MNNKLRKTVASAQNVLYYLAFRGLAKQRTMYSSDTQLNTAEKIRFKVQGDEPYERGAPRAWWHRQALCGIYRGGHHCYQTGTRCGLQRRLPDAPCPT